MSRHNSEGSLSSLSASASPRDSPGPMSPGVVGDKARSGGGGGIQMQIQQLQHEQERVQKKTFTNWMNTYLKQRTPPMKVENLFEDIKDGVVLLSLLEVLSGEKLAMERGKLKRVHYVSNLSTALKFLEGKKIKLVNINVSDIADGKASIVLGLIWTIILYFQIEEAIIPQQSGDTDQRPLSALDKFRMNAKKALLAWTENAITKRYGIEVKDFGKSWRDGLAFNAIVHTIRPDLVDMDKVRKQSARVNLESAFSTAENYLGIARLLDPEDVDVAKPDEKSVMTYVAQFLKAYPEAGEDPSLRKKTKTPAEQEMADYQELMAWCQTEAEEVLQIVEQPVTDLHQEYMDYLAFRAEVDRRGNIYNKLEEKVKTGKSVKFTPETFKPLEETWKKVTRQTRLWLWKLDASLPGKLGKFGDWLNQAEELLEHEEEFLENPNEMATQLGNILQDHKKFFKELEPQKTFFQQVRRAGKYEGTQIPAPQMDNLNQRLQRVCTMAPQRERRLEYEEMKYQLLAFLVASENKLKIWTVKYGHQPDVEGLLADYKNFVHAGNLFKNYDQTYDTCKRNADAYRKANSDQTEIEKMNSYFDEVNGRWKKVSVEIKSVQSMLEEVIDCWRKYNACVDVLTVWLNDGDRVMSRSADEKQQFFADLAQYEEKHKILNESGNFLIETTEEPVAAEIKQTLLMVNRRFKDLVESFQHFKQVEVVGRARKEYNDGLLHLTQWLKDAEELIAREVPCKHAVLRDYLNDIETFSNQIPAIENDFKTTTKTAQSLVKESSQEVVTEMLQSLNIQKEVVVRLRKEFPEKTKHLKAVLPNIESLENGLMDLDRWLSQGEALLESHKLDGTQEETEQRLEKHKAFFSEITYQKSILDSKNKVHQKVTTSKPKLKNVDFSVIDGPVEDVNHRFQNCVRQAKDWEKQLDNLSRLWRVLHQKQHTLEEWLDQAQAVLEDNEDDYDSLIRKHKTFFVRVDDRMLQEYLQACKDILVVLEEDDRPALTESMENIQQRWEQINLIAPIKLVKLEFAVQEEKFIGHVENAEKTVNQQQQKLQRRENVKETLQKHKQMFHQGDFQKTCVKCLETMDCLSRDLLQHDARDNTLRDQYGKHRDRWNKLKEAIDATLLSLKQLPERWKEYNTKMGEFANFVETMEEMQKQLQREDLTSEEYKDLQAKFQRAMKNMEKFGQDSEWLQSNLEELLVDSDDTDAKNERNRLGDMMKRFNNLVPTMDKTSNKSAVFSKAYDFRDGVNKRTSLLDDLLKQAMDQPFIDGLDEARSHLHEHESMMSRLEAERASIMADIEAGRRLQQERNAPTFISKNIHDLEVKLKETDDLAKAKHSKLKKTVSDWETYENEKSQMLQFMKKAEAELEKPASTTGEELAKKDFTAKKELQQTLNKLKGSLAEVQKLNAILCEGASRERRGPLKGEMTDIDKRLDNVSVRLNAKLADLETTIAKWAEYYKRLNHFCDWLNEKEEKLNEVNENKTSTPEEKLEQAKAISAEVYENHITLENLEKDAKGLSQNFRSRETAALKSKLSTVRRQWESLCARANDHSSSLKTNVAHWQMYQNLAQDLMPWIVKAEKYCATELPKCSSLEEAKELYDLHQSFLNECEENIPIFEKMTTEAGYILDQPNMQKELDTLQRRWGDVIHASEERSVRVDKMQGAWVAYNQEVNNLSEILEKFENRLAQEPNVNSTDPQVLEHELALCKTLQEEIRSQQPHLNALHRQFEQVRQHATPEGIQDLKDMEDSVKAKYDKVMADAGERQNMLNGALHYRRNFYSRLEEFEKWIKKTQRKIDTGSEIYSDEVGETLAKLHALKKECDENEPAFEQLCAEFKELLAHCNEDAAVLRDRFDRVMGGYTKIDDLLKNREELCQNWDQYQTNHKDAQTRLKTLQAKLANPNIKEDEVAKINEEVKALREEMGKWDNQVDALDELMATSQLTIKDRATQRTLHFGTELQALDSMCDSVLFISRQKQEHLCELAQLWEDFEAKQAQLVGKLHDVGERVGTAAVPQSSLQGVKDLVREIEDARDDVFACNPEYEQLRELGRQIMQADPSKSTAVQGGLSKVNESWDGVQALLGDKLNYYTGVANAWQQYNDLKQGVVRTLDDVTPLVEADIAFSNQPEVKKALDQHKNAEFELHANQSQLDQMNARGLQLLEELKRVPDFDITVLEQDLDSVNHRWETSNAAIDEHKQNLEAQLVCWDQVQSGKEELESWVNTMVTKLDDSLKNFDDAVTVESCLMKFKEEAPYFQVVLNDMTQKINDLKEMNRDEDIPQLAAEQQRLQKQFDKATSLANQLEGVMANFTDERANLQREIEAETEWLHRMKERLGICDDVSGTDEDIVQRLENCKEISEEMAKHKKNIAALMDKASAMQAKFPSAETSNLAKDASVLNKKFDSVVTRSEKIGDMLLATLEQHCTDAQQQQQRWLSAALEKVNWCGDIAGDRYSVEAKLATIKELINSAGEGEQRKNLAAEKIEALKAVLPKGKQAELEKQKRQAEAEWQSLCNAMQDTQVKLESSVDQWQAYDKECDTLSQWLKDTEARVRNEATLQPDLPSKVQQFELFKSLAEDVVAHQPDFETVRDSAQDISRSTGDGRTASFASQLVNRYQTLAASVEEQVEKREQNIEDHENYLQRYKECLEWIEAQQQGLEDCVDTPQDNEMLDFKLTTMSTLTSSTDSGLGTFNSALESGERLYPNTSNEGREAIRRDLRSLRDKWETYNDNLNETQRKLETSRMQWSTFDENFEQLEKWVVDSAEQLKHEDAEPKNTLQEKKAALQHYRTRCQDILSHQSMLDSISDKGSALASTKAKDKLNKLNAKYGALCQTAQAKVKKAENEVDQHQKLQDLHQQCRDWMTATKDKLAVCAEASGDRQALQNRLDKVQDLVKSMREGEAKVKAVHVQGEKTIPQTGPQGQKAIRKDLEGLTEDWEALASRMENTQENLMHALQALTAYDGSCDQLNKWLRECETAIKDIDLKRTLGDKQGQVERLKKMQQEVNARQRHFEELQDMVAHMQGADSRLVNYSSQLNSRYETLKTNLRDTINRWQDYVREHQAYATNYAECTEWVDTLQRRQEVCADMVGDRADVEDRLTKLQELGAEKEQGAKRIHHSVESGEKLYPSTSAEGREIIRQELRTLRDQWEQVCDQLSETQRKLESCLVQWSSYDENYEQLQKWLLDTEVQLKEDTDMKATLPDKKAQLQNHRVLHQDILSRQHILDNLTEKATSLSHSSPVTKVNKFVDEAVAKYTQLCTQSKVMLEKFEVSVKDHQQYQDAYQDCQDWLHSSRDKVEACADTSGDRVSIQNKLERLREFASHVGDGEKKLRLTQELCHKTSKNTSMPGCEVLRREMDHLQSEWQDYTVRIHQAEEDLDHAMLQWGDFETKFDHCSHWLKNMEQQVKSYELKSTLPEKKAQVDKFKKQREEILSHQPDFDKFTDDAQNLMHTSADVRLSTQVSQLTNRYRGLLSLIKDLIGKWDKYAQDHQAFDNRYSEFKNWLQQAEEKLDSCQQPAADQDTMEEKKAMIQMMIAEKEHGLQRLNSAIEAGEKLYPDTAAAGRENVRQSLRAAKEDWERLFSSLSDTQRRVDNFLLQWSSYAEGQDQLVRWLGDTEATLQGDMDMKNTLQEKRMQLQNNRSLLQDIASHQRIMDSVVEKAQGVLQSTSNPEVADFIKDISSRYEQLAQHAKNQINRSEQSVQDHQEHHDALQAAVDWLTLMKDRLSTCSDTSGDRHTLQNKLDRIEELMSTLPEGEAKVRLCEQCSERAMESTGLKGRQMIQQELDVLRLDWEDYAVKLTSLQDSLEKAVHHWGQYDDQYGIISQWVKDMERKIKEFPLKSTLEEKQEQLKKYQDLMQEIKSRQREVDQFADESQTLMQITGETRVNTSISQLTSRYQALQMAVKDTLKKCEQNVADHKLYRDKSHECGAWLANAKERFADNADTSGSRQELEERLERIQELIAERDTGFARLNQAIEGGEKLYPNTATEGRERVRQELRQHKLNWESLFDDLSSAQRKLEVALVQWTTFDDSYGQVEQWLRDAEIQLEGQAPLRSTLEEKKSQLQNFKVLHQDVLSYQRVIDSVDDKARTLVQSSSDPQLSNFVSQTGARYSKLCSLAKERVQQYEGFVADHQQYNDAYNQCIEWLNSIREKLSLCADIAGDRHTIQNRLDKIQDILATKMEGEPKVKNIVAFAEKVLPSTAPQGKDSIVRETEALRADWEAFVTALQKTKKDLENCMDQWKEFDSWYERCNSWLKEVELKVKDTELKATLKDKQTQLERLRKLQEELNSRQGDIDSLSDSAQDLVRVSTDTRVISQSSQLATKYQTLKVNVKELCRRWEQYVLDHQAYTGSFEQCKSWVVSMRRKLQSQSDVKGDKRSVQERIEKLQDLMADKEEGMHMLQIALDNLQIVLPNTNVAGRDNMRREMQTLQAEYDALSADLNETRNKLDGTLSQWTVYDDSVEQLRRWLNDLENQIHLETQLQNTLQEKKLQLERVKVLQLNINSQQSTIDNLNEKAMSLQQSSTTDANLNGQIRQIVEKYNRLCGNAKELQQNCERYLKNHQQYRDSYMDTSEWLSSTVDKMNACSDVRGDRTAIEAQLQKVVDIQGTLEGGRQKLDDTLARGDTVLPETFHQGQDLIREELNMLTNDFEQFDTDINELQNNLERLRDEWYTYEEEYEKLNQWIKDTESEMKADSELKSTLEEKNMQLERQDALHEEVTNKQTTFDDLTEHAQVLLQSTTDNRVTSQLTQMSSRYTTLMAMSKDFLKRFHQHVEDHQQYAETFTEAVTWLQGSRDKLSVCADTSGDKYTIQSQLEKLQEFSVMKEEGQLLIHTAQSWGEKTMNNTSMDGREMIRQELQQLQQEWDVMISEVTDTKVMLESCLLQWTDFNDSYEQIQKRLREMEKRLRGSDPKIDLGEKKAELQRIKGIYQDVVSFEHMVESAGTKAQDLMQKSPASKASTDTSQIINKYHQIKDLAMDMLAKAEMNVAQHTAYHDACNNFVSWQRVAREKLATCSDTFGEKSAIVGKIERARALVEGLNEGAQRLAEATKSGESTLPNTSPTGQTKIRQELKSMNKDFEEFRAELMSAQEDLEECLMRWTQFEDGYLHFNNWLKETETYLRSELDFKATMEEKKQHWEQYQAFAEEIQYKQAELDHVNEKAQSLLQTNADAKTSHAITQLTTRYQGVIALSKDIVKNLATYYNNHLHYNDSHNDFCSWLAETKLHLQTIHRTAGSKEDLGSKLENMTEMQAAMDQGHSHLRQVLECSERTLPSTNTRGCQIIRHECETAKAEYENLLTDMSQAKRGLESALTQWGDFDHSYEQFHVWLTAMEAKVNSDPGLKTDLPEKRSSLEKYKALQADCLAHRELLERLEEKASNVNDAHPQSRVLDLRSRYSAVTTAMKEIVSKQDSQVGAHEEYRRSYIGCLDWMANTRHRLQRLSDFSGDRRSLQDRLQQLKEFKGEMRHGQDMVNNATQLGERVCMTTAPRGQDAIHKEIQTLKDDWSSFAGAVNEVESNLEVCIGNWLEMDDALSSFTHWMEKMERKMKNLNDGKSDSSRKEHLFHEAEDILQEIVNKKSSLEVVREKGEAVAQRSTDPRLSNNMMQLATRYQALISAAKNLVSQLSENARDHKEYNDAFDAATKWLATMADHVQECNDTAGDWHTLEERMDTIKNITASMDEGLQKVNRVCDLAEKILPNTSSEGKRLIEQQVTELTNEWEKLNLSITNCNAMLEGVQERWNDYEEYYGSLVKWLADMENTLGMDPEPKASLVEKKTQLDKYKLMKSDIENHQRMVNELAERVANLEALSANSDVTESLQDVQNRYDRVRQRCCELVNRLDRNYQEHLGFHEAQQESEKWLLQTSFRLMNHNSLNCSTMELTQRQIEKHRSLLREIEEYRLVLDRVSMKGRRLIDNNSRTPRLAEQMQAQLQNLEESYINLQATAEQIRDRLNDVLKRWQEYRGSLESTDRFLKDEFPHWLQDTDGDVPDSKVDAQRKMEGVKGMMDRLVTMRQEIDTAAGRCENLGSVENLDQSDLPQNTPIYKLAQQVNGSLQEATGEVEKRLSDLRENMQQWDSVDRMRVDLRAWLHDMQEEVDELEKQPSKLHAEACEVDINKLQAIREEVQARGPAVEALLARYRELTQHNPALQDPVVKAVKDDWEELLGQIENLIDDRDHALQAARDLQARENEMDDDLENYINELEKIESANVGTVDKAAMLKTRKPCRSTQTPRGSARNPNRSFLTGDSDNDSGDDRFLFPPKPGRPGSRNSSNQSLKRKRGPGGPRSPSRQSHRGSRPGSRLSGLKKTASGAALDSESEESGYGETYYTMHASSFDNVLDDTVFDDRTLNTMRGTPLGLENHFSDGESTVSYLSTHAFGANPEDLRDATCQTPGHTSTQTPGQWKQNKPRTMQTQTGSNTSLHSIGNQTRRSSGSRADLLRNILFEVKGLKQQRGLDTSSYNGTDDETNSVRSDTTIKKETLQHVLHEVRELREADATGTIATQTVQEEGTQTSMKLFPEGDPVRNARLQKFNKLMDEMKEMKGSRPGTPGSRSRASTRSETPVNRSRGRTPTRLNQTFDSPVQNGFTNHYAPQPMYAPPQNLNATAPAMMMHPPQPPQVPYIAGRRMVTQDDLNNISHRLERLSSYQPPRRATPPPPPPQPQYVVPVYAAPPRRKLPPEDAYLSDESEYGDAQPPRRRRVRPDLESALAEASRSALQLKRLSKRMKDSLRDDMQYDFL